MTPPRHLRTAAPGWTLLPSLLLLASITAQAQVQSRRELPLPEAALEALQFNNCPRAVGSLEPFLAQNPGHREAQFQLAYCYSRLGRSKEAVELYRAVIAKDPPLPEAHLNLGVLLIETGQAAEAVQQFRRAAELEPERFRTRLYLAAALEQNGEPPAAVDEYLRAIELDPNSREARQGLVALLNSVDNLGDYTEIVDGLLEQFPLDAGLVELRAEIHRRHGRPEEALAVYERYFSAASEQLNTRREEVAQLRYRAGIQAQSLGRFEDALRHHAIAGELGGDKLRWGSTYGRARALAALGRYDQAAPLYQEAIEMMGHDQSIDTLEEFGFVLFRAARYEEAVRVYLELVRLRPGETPLYEQLALTFHRLKNYPAVIETLEKRRRVAEEIPATLFLRAISLDQLDRCTEALEFYQRFLQVNKARDTDEYFQASGRVRALKKGCKAGR